MADPAVLSLVLAGGEGKRLAPLTADRAKPAVPFAGHYRLVDFVLSNLANGGYLKNRRPHPVQEPQPRPPHLPHLAHVAPPRELREPGAGADATRPALVLRVG